MERRNFVTTATAAALAGLVYPKNVLAAEGVVSAKPMSKELKAVVDTAFDCLVKGEICIALCNAVLQSGKTSMAECQRAVLNMVAVCDAMARTAAYNTGDPKKLKTLAKLCADFCRDCEKECKVHSEHHAECKACMESCIACAKACDTFAKA